MHLHQILHPLSILFLSLSPSLRPQSLQIFSIFSLSLSLSIFYPSPYTRLALAAPCFLNLSSSILFGSLLRSSNTRGGPPIFSPLNPPRIFVSARTRPPLLSLLSSPSFGLSLSRSLSLSLSFFLSFCPLYTVSLMSTTILYGSLLRTAFPRYDPAEPRRWRHGKKAALKELHIFYVLTATWVVQNGRQ